MPLRALAFLRWAMEVGRLIAELEASPPAARKQALLQLKAVMRKHGMLDMQQPASGLLGLSLWRPLIGTLVVSLALLLFAPMVSDHNRECACVSSQMRPLTPLPHHTADTLPLLPTQPTSRNQISRMDHQNHTVPGRERYPSHSAFDHPRDAIRRLRPRRNTSDFPLLLCIGHGKTATKSLNKALVMLGYNTAHFYGAGVYGLLYDNAAEDKNRDFLFNVAEERHVDAVLDTPVVDFYNEILLSYPNARVILTVRKLNSWLKSQQLFYNHYSHSCRNWLAPWRRGSNLVFGTECPSPTQAVKRYLLHNRAVVDAVPKGRLLVMDIPGGDGWEKLCPFIGRQIPINLTFPNRH